MFPSDQSDSAAEAAAQLEKVFAGTIDGTGTPPDAELLCRILSTAVRLYAVVNEGRDEALPPLDERVSTTDAVIVATALLKARDLNPFDLALWFSRDRVAG